MATIKYKINNTWTNIKDIVFPLNTTAPTDLSGAGLGGGQWSLKRRPLILWKPSSTLSITTSTSIGNLSGECTFWGATPERENLFASNNEGIGIKTDGAFFVYILWQVVLNAATQVTLYLRTAYDDAALQEYWGLHGYFHAGGNSIGRWLNSTHCCIVRGNDSSTATRKWHKLGWKGNNTGVTGQINANTKMEICPVTRANYWQKSSLS